MPALAWAWPPPAFVQSTTSTPPAQLAYVEQPLPSGGDGAPLQRSMSAHFWNVACAPRNVTGMPGTTDEYPPSYGTRLSPLPRKEITVIGRGGWQPATFSCNRSKEDGATAANKSAAWQARTYAMPPPIEKPVAYTRFGSMQAVALTWATSARAKATSSAVGAQHGPTFQALPEGPESP